MGGDYRVDGWVKADWRWNLAARGSSVRLQSTHPFVGTTWRTADEPTGIHQALDRT